MYRIARHAAFNHGQVRANYNRLLQDYPAAPPDEDDPGRKDFENAEQVHHGLQQLPLPQREVLTLFFLEDFSIEAMAQLHGHPRPGRSKSRLHHAKKALRAVLREED